MTSQLTGPLNSLRCSITLFQLPDAVFSGLALAYAYSLHGMSGVAWFICFQQLFTLIGHFAAYRILTGIKAVTLFMTGCSVFSLGVLGLSQAATLPELCFGAAVAGLARGVCWGSRLWLEMHIADAEQRGAYLRQAEGVNALIKVAAPLFVALLVLKANVNTAEVLIGAGLICFCLSVVGLVVRPSVFAPAATSLEVIAVFKNKEYWKTAPFYFLDGFSHALRTALLVSGTMAVVGTVGSYALMEALGGAAAGLLLLFKGKSMLLKDGAKRLKIATGLMLLAWGLLLLATKYGLVPLIGFSVLYATILPVFVAEKSHIALAGMLKGAGSKESNSMARSILLMISRLTALGLVLTMGYMLKEPLLSLQLLILVAMGSQLLEFSYAKKLSAKTAA